MKSLICIVAITIWLANYTNANQPVRVRGIYITQSDENYQSSLGVVNGVRPCGGHGQVFQWRIDGCSGEDTCRLEANGHSFPTELEFVPSQDIDSLGIRVNIVDDGTAHNVYERTIAHSTVQRGDSYIVHAAASLSEQMKGSNLTVQYILYQVNDDNVEICAEADFELY